MDAQWGRRIAGAYRGTILILANSVLALVLLNVLAMAFFGIRDATRSDPVTDAYGRDAVQRVHRRADPREVDPLLRETWSRSFAYEPYTQFKEIPFAGQFVNVSPHGFRHSVPQGPWPPDKAGLNIFVFGGSTTFGYGVADGETIPSGIQTALARTLNRPVRVYNFGRGFYYSTQERVLYEQLLTAGAVPDVAIFIDGLNDFTFRRDEPFFTAPLQSALDSFFTVDVRWITRLPLARLARGVGSRLTAWTAPPPPARDEAALFPASDNDPALLDTVITRYLKNKQLIEAASAAFGVTPVFAWQPVPTYDFDFHDFPFLEAGFGNLAPSRFGYPLVAARMAAGELGNNFLWSADLHRNRTEPLYVDIAHYSSSMSTVVAEHIAGLMVSRGLVGGAR